MSDLPPPYRLVVTQRGEQKSQGTAWFVTRSDVITAWHVIRPLIGDHGPLSDARFELEVDGAPLNLEYELGSEDGPDDLAVLHVRKEDGARVRDAMVLTLADHKPEANAHWSARGFPSDLKGEEQTADGHVTNPETKASEVELFVNQGTRDTWAGISGAALMIDEKVAGIITAERGRSTALARPYTAVEKLVPELKRRGPRRRYLEWVCEAFRPPPWCEAYRPNVVSTDSSLFSVDDLVGLVAARTDRRPWLIAGDDSEGREPLLRRIAASFVRKMSADHDDCLDLPLWAAPSEAPDPWSLAASAADHGKLDVAEAKAAWMEAANQGRALLVMDGASASDLDRMAKEIGPQCTILAGVSRAVAEDLVTRAGAERAAAPHVYRLAPLSEKEKRDLAAHWLGDEQARKCLDTESARESLRVVSSPLAVSVWCRAQLASTRVLNGDAGHLEERPSVPEGLLHNLVDTLLTGRAVEDHPSSRQVQNREEVWTVLSGLAYLTLIDGVDVVEPTYLATKAYEDRLGLPEHATSVEHLDSIARQCGLLLKVRDAAYRFTHPILQELFASCAMQRSFVPLSLERIANHAERLIGRPEMERWSRALALRLDNPDDEDDATKILGALLNYGLPPGYGTQLRNETGPLGASVRQAVLHTKSLYGGRLRRALGWLDFPHDWTGYRPDDWRMIEEVLRYLGGVAARVDDDETLAQIFGRFLRDSKVIDVALIRYALAKEIRKRSDDKRPCGALLRLYERKQFFMLAGRPCSESAETSIKGRLCPISEGWFFMGAPPREERSWPNEWPRHRVFLHAYRVSRTEVTNQQYELFDPSDREPVRFSTGHPKELMKEWQCYPVVRVCWYEAWCFAEWLGLKLPTEAQWENAARGDSRHLRPEIIPQDPKPYWFEGGESELKNSAWYRDNSCGHACAVREEPREHQHKSGLGGLCGNVWEWCRDEQGFNYTEGDCTDPIWEKPKEDIITNRVIRGGSFDSPAWNCRLAVRHYAYPTVRADTIGFRLCEDSVEPVNTYVAGHAGPPSSRG